MATGLTWEGTDSGVVPQAIGQSHAGMILEGDRGGAWPGASAGLLKEGALKLASGVLGSRAASALMCWVTLDTSSHLWDLSFPTAPYKGGLDHI